MLDMCLAATGTSSSSDHLWKNLITLTLIFKNSKTPIIDKKQHWDQLTMIKSSTGMTLFLWPL